MKYTVFISLLTELSVDKIVAGLFRLGYSVAPLTPNGYIASGDDSPAAILGMQILTIGDPGEDTEDYETLRNSIKAFLDENEISYYSIVVITGQPGIAWANSNISLTKARQRAAMRRDVPYLKLVRKTPPPLPKSE